MTTNPPELPADRLKHGCQPPAAGNFFHPKNIVVGRGRVMWAERPFERQDVLLPPGWVLPGGARTTDHELATLVAGRIDHLTTTKERQTP